MNNYYSIISKNNLIIILGANSYVTSNTTTSLSSSTGVQQSSIHNNMLHSPNAVTLRRSGSKSPHVTHSESPQYVTSVNANVNNK